MPARVPKMPHKPPANQPPLRKPPRGSVFGNEERVPAEGAETAD